MKRIISVGIMIGLYVGLFATLFFQFGVMKGASMSVDDSYKECYGLIYKNSNVSIKASDKVCFRVDWSDKLICHRCEKITNIEYNYDYVCYGDNKKSTVDYIQTQDIYGIVLTELCR
jgi:hypothetical protein